ncbi:MAG: S41 family peptidase [bacterium]|nr:S41 family peptidase [bacterium]
MSISSNEESSRASGSTRAAASPATGRKRERRVWVTLLAISLSINFFAFASPGFADREQSHRYQQILQHLLYYMENLYVEPLKEEELLKGAVRGLLASSGDPYTRFLDRTELKDFLSLEEGKRIGIGVEVSLQDGLPVVIAPIAGGPAEAAGILPGDRIMTVDGKKTEDVPFGKLVERITGERGTVVELGIARDSFEKPLTIRVTRGEFDLEYVRTRFFEKEQIGYIRLYHFFGEESGSVDKFRAGIAEFKRRRARGIIVDLRSNPGGHLEMAGIVTGFFLKEGQVVVRAKGRTPEMNTEIKAQGDVAIVPEDMPVVVLINEGSASASEIMAGALQDHKRATLIGAQSFGKASVQKVIRPLPDETAALITIQKYFTPLNRGIHGKGLKPDIVVETLRPNASEVAALEKLAKDDFFSGFKQKHAEYRPGLVDLFLSELGQRGLKMRREVAVFALQDKYRIWNPGKPDPAADPQLARGIQHLQSAVRR